MSTVIENGIEISHVNGQLILRRCKPVYDSNENYYETPERGGEIFVARLPEDIKAETWMPQFEKYGRVYSMRIMMNFSGKSRGYGFVQYYRKEDARCAVRQMHNRKFSREQSKLIVHLSIDNRRLFFGHLPNEVTAVELQWELGRVVEGIDRVIIHTKAGNPKENRGYAFVEFINHGKAAIARRNLTFGNFVMNGTVVTVDWAEPVPEISQNDLKSLNKLFMNKIPLHYTSAQLHNIFRRYLVNIPVTKIYKATDYAFLHFDNKYHAQSALEKLSGISLDGDVINLEWARPTEYNRENRRNQSPNHFCRSVPPKTRRMIQSRIQTKQDSASSSSSASSSTTSYSSSSNFGANKNLDLGLISNFWMLSLQDQPSSTTSTSDSN